MKRVVRDSHPLEKITLKALETGGQDAITLIAHLSGQTAPPGPLLNAYKRVAKDVLENLEARGLAESNDASWYTLPPDYRKVRTATVLIAGVEAVFDGKSFTSDDERVTWILNQTLDVWRSGVRLGEREGDPIYRPDDFAHAVECIARACLGKMIAIDPPEEGDIRTCCIRVETMTDEEPLAKPKSKASKTTVAAKKARKRGDR